MAKKALCVGINDYPYEGNDLFGCVNDAHAWCALLRDHYGFLESNITIVTDTDATKHTIMTKLQNLVANSQAGDELVYSFSGHGTYVADVSGDEPDYDEGQCAYDGIILDDELRELFDSLPDDVHLTVISDSCHSGSVTRGEDNPLPELPDRRERFLNPELLGNASLPPAVFAKIKENLQKLAASGRERRAGLNMKEVLLSGCRADEVAYDAKFGDKHYGAMTFHALQAIEKLGYAITYKQLHEELTELLQEANFPQHSQLEGGSAQINRPLFT